MQPDPFATEFEGKRVLVTGGLGFIGSNLALRLVDLGAHVVLVDSLIPEYGGNLFNVAGILDKVTINISDVRDPHSFRYLVRGQEILFNLAGQTSHMDSMADPFTDLEINCRAQLAILESCRQFNPSIRVIFASTRQLYGRPDYLPVDEKHPLRPVDVNGINKLAGEWYHLLYSTVHGVRSTNLRLTNTYGPRMRIKDARQTFVGIWIRRILEGLPFEVWGGDQLRDFTYVDDCVDALLRAAITDEAIGMAINLGGDGVVSLRELAETLTGVAGGGEYTVREFPSDYKAIDIGDYHSDWSLARRVLGWEPRMALRDGLRATLEYFRDNRQHYL
ncbi:MAG: NAD-dependent epimerase/dehydratase family protein [Holophagae bacterium]|nr:NAD-dependent epimerase/dehydratase family protein [Holophagae bacterium]